LPWLAAVFVPFWNGWTGTGFPGRSARFTLS
jgi:hypothetical protein